TKRFARAWTPSVSSTDLDLIPQGVQPGMQNRLQTQRAGGEDLKDFRATPRTWPLAAAAPHDGRTIRRDGVGGGGVRRGGGDPRRGVVVEPRSRLSRGAAVGAASGGRPGRLARGLGGRCQRLDGCGLFPFTLQLGSTAGTGAAALAGRRVVCIACSGGGGGAFLERQRLAGLGIGHGAVQKGLTTTRMSTIVRMMTGASLNQR